MQANRTALAFAALAYASGAFAQTTSTTMDMGDGMTHIDTMGPNGAMSSSNCMNMGGDMATCNTMDMSQPQRTYPTPDMSRPQRTYARPDVSEPEPAFPAPYVSRLPMPAPVALETALVSRAVALPSLAPIAPMPMALVSSKPIPKGTPTWAVAAPDTITMEEFTAGTPVASATGASGDKDQSDTEYTVTYLGHTFSLVGPKGLSIDALRSGFDQAWRDNPWVEYSSNDAGTVYYFSITSEKIYSDRIEIWTKADHSKDRTTKARSTMALFEIRCNHQEMRELQQTQYNASGKVLLSFDQPAMLSRVIPETVGSALLDEVCKVM